jgi:hypothetical protein
VQIGVAVRSGGQLAPATERMIDVLRDVAHELEREGDRRVAQMASVS